MPRGSPPAVRIVDPPGRRNRAGARVSSLAERRSAAGGSPDRLWNAVDFLDVERSARYLPEGDETYCHVYVHDVADLCGGFLPRVWWADPAAATAATPVVAGETVHELSANELHDRLVSGWAEAFGWTVERVDGSVRPDRAQGLANGGERLVVICASNADRPRPGHVTVVLPESDGRGARAERNASGRVRAPLQTHASAENRRHFAEPWFEADAFAPVLLAHRSVDPG